MKPLSWTIMARERLNTIVEYITRNNPDAAREWAIKLVTRVDALEEFPEMGRVVPEAGRKEIRELIEGDYPIIYRITGKTQQSNMTKKSPPVMKID